MATKDIKPRIRVPKKLTKGELFEVKTLISHRMETGLRKDKETGATIPRDIVRGLTVTYNGREVLKSVWHTAMSANPYTSFYVRAEDSGPMVFTWIDEANQVYTKEVAINVAG
ncbi:thiosulfate oxidation carrier complex protein SoxZ [Magnetovibrio sp.]|uniref:thiosulfate oxidation carrier complex protein SoxZ n=1 Tax=Magnetovibrio sp. TaxID=2024836 RepID=UPI002F93D73D